MVKRCSYGTCNSDNRYTTKDYMQGVSFVKFPKPWVAAEKEKCARWVHLCGRKYFTTENVTKDTYICTKHFIGGKGPTIENPDPLKRPETKYDVIRAGKTPRQPNKKIIMACTTSRKRKAYSDADHSYCSTTVMVEPEISTEVAVVPLVTSVNNTASSSTCAETSSQGSQTETRAISSGVKEQVHLKLEILALKNKISMIENNIPKQVSSCEHFNLEKCMQDDKTKFYTGLSSANFECLWNFLGQSVFKLHRVNEERSHQNANKSPSKLPGPSRKLTPRNELFLTLVRLRLGLLNEDLGYRFGISSSLVSSIITSWVQLMFQQFNAIRKYMYPTRQIVQRHMPNCFRKMKSTRVIIDASEFFTETPRHYTQQGNMYSSYKNHCTLKLLMGIAPSGAISFVSDVFEGAISDRELFIQSGLLQLIEHGDLVLADRGFTIADLLLEKGASLNIPPFLQGRARLTPSEEAKTKLLAKLRIHVERAFERIKKFKILKRIIPLNILPIFSQMVFVVACLVNFQEPLVR